MKRENDIFQRTVRRTTVFIWMAAVLLLAGCNKEQNLSAPGGNGKLEVRLVIDTKQTQTRATDVSVINSLRVYVFDATGKPVGYTYNGNLQESGAAYYLPLRLQQGGNLEFFVLANEGGLTYGSGTNAKSLDENISHNELHALVFDRSKVTNGSLMSGWVTEEITDTQGVTVVECPLTRDVAELNLYFATTGGAVQITDVTLHDYKTDSPVFWGDTDDAGQGNTYSDNSLGLIVQNANDFPTLSESAANNLTDYTTQDKVATAYLVKNSDGSDSWDTEPNTEKKPRLAINYTVGGTPRTAVIYLPPIAINHQYNICCLVKAAGILLHISIDDWEEAGYEITWTDESNIAFGPEPTELYITEVISESDMLGGQNAGFRISAGQDNALANVKWQATIDNVTDFTFADQSGQPIPAPEGVLTDKGETFWVKALRPFNEASAGGTKTPQCRLQIKLEQADGSWLVCSLPWDETEIQDFILIKQVQPSSN